MPILCWGREKNSTGFSKYGRAVIDTCVEEHITVNSNQNAGRKVKTESSGADCQVGKELDVAASWIWRFHLEINW